MATTETAQKGKVLMTRSNDYPNKVEMVYWGPGQPLSVIITDCEDETQTWITPEEPQLNLMDCFNHPFCDYWQVRAHLPILDARWA